MTTSQAAQPVADNVESQAEHHLIREKFLWLVTVPTADGISHCFASPCFDDTVDVLIHKMDRCENLGMQRDREQRQMCSWDELPKIQEKLYWPRSSKPKPSLDLIKKKIRFSKAVYLGIEPPKLNGRSNGKTNGRSNGRVSGH